MRSVPACVLRTQPQLLVVHAAETSEVLLALVEGAEKIWEQQ